MYLVTSDLIGMLHIFLLCGHQYIMVSCAMYLKIMHDWLYEYLPLFRRWSFFFISHFNRHLLIKMILKYQYFLMKLGWKVLHLKVALGGGQEQHSKLFFHIMGALLMVGKNNQDWRLSKGKLLFLFLFFIISSIWGILFILGSNSYFSRTLTNLHLTWCG